MLQRRWELRLGGCVLALGLAGCPAGPAGGPDAGPDSSDGVRLNQLVEAYFEEMLPFDPLYATFIGDNRYDDRLANDISPEHQARRLELERRYADQVRKIEPQGLAPSDRLTWEVFLRERDLAIERSAFPTRLLPIDQLFSVPSILAVLGSGQSAQPFATRADYERFIGRMRDFSVWADQAIANMREGMHGGIVQPRIVVDAAVAQIEQLARPAPDNVFYAPLKDLATKVPGAAGVELGERYSRTIETMLLPAYSRLAEFLAREYRPAARASVAWTELPDGDAWYGFLVRAATTTSLGPDEIHALGVAEVARIRREMDRVREQVGFKGDLAAFFTHLKTDPAFYFTSADELLAGYRELKARIDARVPELFGLLPQADYEIREVEEFRAASAAGASYQTPAPDGSRPGIFYVNTYNLMAQPRFGMETLSLHEAAPGHHFQQSIQQALTDLPKFRRFGGDYVAYVEGWALYAESLGADLGLFTDPYQFYGRLSDEMLRAMRLVVDTGLHTRGWSRQQAIDYMLANSSLAESDVQSEVDRYIANPGQALGYKIGEIRIRGLREQAMHELGDRFDVRRFHDEVLRDGALPMDVLAAKIGRWVAAERT